MGGRKSRVVEASVSAVEVDEEGGRVTCGEEGRRVLLAESGGGAVGKVGLVELRLARC